VIHLDSSFLIDLMRERSRGTEGAAQRRLDDLQDEELAVSLFAACELYFGAELAKNPRLEREKVARLFGVVELALPAEGFAETYGRLMSETVRRGERVATMDVLIATSAVMVDAPLLTRNSKDFGRIRGLRLLSY